MNTEEIGDLRTRAKKAGLTFRLYGERYRVNYKGGREGTAFYVDSYEDGIAAIEAMEPHKGKRL